jgi:hypothetical protein
MAAAAAGGGGAENSYITHYTVSEDLLKKYNNNIDSIVTFLSEIILANGGYGSTITRPGGIASLISSKKQWRISVNHMLERAERVAGAGPAVVSDVIIFNNGSIWIPTQLLSLEPRLADALAAAGFIKVTTGGARRRRRLTRRHSHRRSTRRYRSKRRSTRRHH